VPPIVAQLLISRGVYEADAARTFLDAKLTGLRDPDLLPGAAEAADRIYAAVREKRKIVVYGDYDADGMTGTAILLSCLRLLGAEVSHYVPNRLEEAAGRRDPPLRPLSARGASLVVSGDCSGARLTEPALRRDRAAHVLAT